MKYDKNTIYVLEDKYDEYIRIMQESSKTSLLISPDNGFTRKSFFDANFEIIKLLTDPSHRYKIIQEWK